VGELALHYLDRFSISVVKVLSKFDLRRLCRVIGATPLARLGSPTAEEAGHVDVMECIEIGSDRVTVFRQEEAGTGEKSRMATIVLRGATTNSLDDLERAVDDGVNVIKAIVKDGRMVPGAAATELELARTVDTYGASLKGLNQHAVRRYASALEVVPFTLAESAGLDATEVLSRLYARHEQPNGKTWGIDIEVRYHFPSSAEMPSLTLVSSCLMALGRVRWHSGHSTTSNIRLSCCQSMGPQSRNGCSNHGTSC
jgi:T-complex protein 1 subunit theta